MIYLQSCIYFHFLNVTVRLDLRSLSRFATACSRNLLTDRQANLLTLCSFLLCILRQQCECTRFVRVRALKPWNAHSTHSSDCTTCARQRYICHIHTGKGRYVRPNELGLNRIVKNAIHHTLPNTCSLQGKYAFPPIW